MQFYVTFMLCPWRILVRGDSRKCISAVTNATFIPRELNILIIPFVARAGFNASQFRAPMTLHGGVVFFWPFCAIVGAERLP